MPQRFTGTIYTSGGKKLDGAKVVLKSGSFSQGTTTDINGTFNILTSNDIASSGSTITVSKENYILYSISNPQPTGAYFPPKTQIDPTYGGIINLSNTFEAGKYLISSLNPKDQERLYWELLNIQEFVKANSNNYELVIVASESQVPNYDREEFLEDGVTPNTNWAGPPNTNTFKTPELIAKKLSEKRSNSLKTYINNFFKENGLSFPNITSDVRVGDLVYNQGDDIKNFIPDQYVKLEARLVAVNCAPQTKSDTKRSIDLTLIKPPGATRVILDAKEFPDRFGVNVGNKNKSGEIIKANPYYSLNPSTPGGVEAWGFITYLSLLLFNKYILKNDKDLIKTKVTPSQIRTIMESNDIKGISTLIKEQLEGFIYLFEANLQGETTASTIKSSIGSIPEALDWIFFKGPSFNRNFDTTDMYIIQIKKEYSIIRLDDIGVNQSFILNSTAGNVVRQSIFDFKICNDTQT
jgi:hypothetical protein